jgi:hypothetical protein
MKNLIKAARIAGKYTCKLDMGREALEGVCIDIDGGIPVMVSTDGHRLSIQALEGISPDHKLTLGANQLAELAVASTAKIEGNYIEVQAIAGQTSVAMRDTAHNYPDWKKVIPTDCKGMSYRVNRRALIAQCVKLTKACKNHDKIAKAEYRAIRKEIEAELVPVRAREKYLKGELSTARKAKPKNMELIASLKKLTEEWTDKKIKLNADKANVSNDAIGPVFSAVLDFQGSNRSIECGRDTVGFEPETVDALLDGETLSTLQHILGGIKIALNVKYLKEALQGLSGEYVDLELRDPLTPIKLTSEGDTMVVMPMRL